MMMDVAIKSSTDGEALVNFSFKECFTSYIEVSFTSSSPDVLKICSNSSDVI